MLYRVTCANGVRVKILCGALEKEEERILRVNRWALIQLESDIVQVEVEVKSAGEVDPTDIGESESLGERLSQASVDSNGSEGGTVDGP